MAVCDNNTACKINLFNEYDDCSNKRWGESDSN